MNKDQIISEFKLQHIGHKGWMSSDDLKCPICGKSDKFAVVFTDDGGIVNCFRSSHYKTSLFNYLMEIGRKDLLKGYKKLDLNKGLPNMFDEEDDEEKKGVNIIKPPLGFKRIYQDDYLDSRGFLPEQYDRFNIGITNLDSRFNNYIISLIKDSSNSVIHYLARSKHSKEWHEENLKLYKEGKSVLKLRYINSNTDFSTVLLGENEINEKTTTILLVEGLFDKANVDKQLDLYNQDDIKCCCTFGNKISDEQINILRKYKNISIIIIMYDFGTIDQCKQYGIILSKYYNVFVAEFDDKNMDAGEANKNYLLKKISNLRNILYFYKNRLGKKLHS